MATIAAAVVVELGAKPPEKDAATPEAVPDPALRSVYGVLRTTAPFHRCLNSGTLTVGTAEAALR